MTQHVPVMCEGALTLLDVHSNKDYIDCTLGGGGHTEALLERNGPRGRVIAFELDEETIHRAQKRLKKFGKRFIVLRENFRAILQIPRSKLPIGGVLYDLGTSTDLLKNSGRGFSFLLDEPLDMRFDLRQNLTARTLVRTLSERSLADCLFTYGEERYSRRIAKEVVQRRRKTPFEKTVDLVDAVRASVPKAYRHGRLHCATRTFQALRIAVNDELGALQESLPDAFSLLEEGGRLVVISFHSLEDRIVKRFMRENVTQKKGTLLAKKPLTPSDEEQKRNPASRSAKMRGIVKN